MERNCTPSQFSARLIALALGLFSLSTLLIACGDNSGGDKIGRAPVPLCFSEGTNLANGQCQRQQALAPGYTPYPIQGNGHYVGAPNFQNGFCLCPNGTFPVYSDQYGLGCLNGNGIFPQQHPHRSRPWDAQSGIFGPSVNSVDNFSFFSQQFPGLFAPHSGWNSGVNVGGSVSCSIGALELCDSRIPNGCGIGGYCKLIGGAGVIGTCVETHKEVGR